MDKKKIVIISSEIFPRNTPRANRATELAKEFGKQKYEVFLYAVLGNYDYTNFESEHNIKVKNLGKYIFSNFNSDGIDKNDYLLTRIISKLTEKYTEFPSLYLSILTYIVLRREKNVDLLLTIAVPFTIHWGAALFRSSTAASSGTVWVADCGDPYMGNPNLLHKKPFYFKYIEKWFCRKANFVTVPIEAAKDAYYPEFRDKIRVIPQGFNLDEMDVSGMYKGNDVTTFIYSGTFYKNLRDPRPFLDFLLQHKNNFKFIVYTKTPELLQNYKSVLKNKLIIKEYLPRKELLIELSKADFILNLENISVVQSPSKLIDYSISGRPILSINTAEKLNEGKITNYLNGNYENSLILQDISQYNIASIIKQLVALWVSVSKR